MSEYYISLCRGLVGYYVLVLADNSGIVRQHAANYFGKMWCSVYTESEFLDMRYKLGDWSKLIVINEHDPIVLGASSDWE